MTIEWIPHPGDPSTINVFVNGVSRGHVRRHWDGWRGWTDYTSESLRPAENTEPAARALVESAIRRALVGA